MPVKCPCEICLRPCKRNQCAIQCDMCGGWIHLKCTVISPLKFDTLCSSTEPYLCQNCCSELFPFQTLDDKQLLNEMRNDDKINFDIKLNGYHFYHKGTTTRWGGVGLFIKESLSISICKEFDLNIPNCEDMWIQLDLRNNKKCIVGVIYRHPKQKLSEF